MRTSKFVMVAAFVVTVIGIGNQGISRVRAAEETIDNRTGTVILEIANLRTGNVLLANAAINPELH